VQLALRTLGTFPFGASVLLGFVRRNVVEYLDDDDPSTRREAALTCCRLLELRSDRVTRGGGDIGTSIHGGDAALMALNANSASVSSVSHASHVTNGAPSRWSAWTGSSSCRDCSPSRCQVRSKQKFSPIARFQHLIASLFN
jgi:hypothetical protein